MLNDLEFVQIFAARISHDLAGTLGAINSAIEFIQSDDEDVREKALELMEISSNQANDRLRFMRYAYGVSKYSGDADIDSVRELCMLLGKDENINVEFTAPGKIANDQSIDVNVGKLIVCLAHLARSNLLRGGLIKISWMEDRSNSIVISAMGNDVKSPKDLHDIISGKDYVDVAINPTNIHAYYMHKLIAAQKINLEIRETHDGQVDYIVNL